MPARKTEKLPGRDTPRPLAQRRGGGLLSRTGFVASAVTTICCLGLPAAISLASAIGATFLIRDATLQPLLLAALAVTVAGSAWTSRRHRAVAPLLLTVTAGALIYSALYGPLNMGIAGVGATVLIWVGLAGLLGAQLWDALHVRRAAN